MPTLRIEYSDQDILDPLSNIEPNIVYQLVISDLELESAVYPYELIEDALELLVRKIEPEIIKYKKLK